MNRLLLIYVLICNLFTPPIYASGIEPKNDVPQFEEPYFENGYTSVGDALKKCEMLHHREIKMPIKLPPIAFTHHLGRCVNDKENINDELQIEYLHEEKGMNHYNIDVRPIEQKLNYGKLRNITQYKLNDGNQALFFTTQSHKSMYGFNILVFEKNGWQYRVSVDTRVESKVTLNTLLRIAESVK